MHIYAVAVILVKCTKMHCLQKKTPYLRKNEYVQYKKRKLSSTGIKRRLIPNFLHLFFSIVHLHLLSKLRKKTYAPHKRDLHLSIFFGILLCNEEKAKKKFGAGALSCSQSFFGADSTNKCAWQRGRGVSTNLKSWLLIGCF